MVLHRGWSATGRFVVLGEWYTAFNTKFKQADLDSEQELKAMCAKSHLWVKSESFWRTTRMSSMSSEKLLSFRPRKQLENSWQGGLRRGWDCNLSIYTPKLAREKDTQWGPFAKWLQQIHKVLFACKDVASLLQQSNVNRQGWFC